MAESARDIYYVQVGAKLHQQSIDRASAQFEQRLKRVAQGLQGAKFSPRGLDSITKSSQRASQGMQTLSRNIKSSTGELRDFGLQAGLAFRRFLAFSIPAGAVFGVFAAAKKGVKDAISFEREMIKVAQVSGQTTKGLSGLGEQITSLSTEFGTSSTDLVAATRQLKQAGISVRDIQKVLRTLAKTTLAPTFDNLQDTTEGAIAILAQFGDKAKELDSGFKVTGVKRLAADLGEINALSKAFAVESADLIFAIKRAGGAFKSAGGNLQELLALFTAVRSTTRETAQTIATGLRTIIPRLQRPAGISFFKKLGVELTTLNKITGAQEFIGPLKAIEKISALITDLGEGDVRTAKIAEQLGGLRQFSKVIPLLTQGEKIQRALQVAQKGQNSLDKDSVIALKSLSVQLDIVREKFSALFRDLLADASFQLFLSTVLRITNAILDLSKQLTSIIPLVAAAFAFRGLKAAPAVTKGFISAFKSRRSVLGINPSRTALARGGTVMGGEGGIDDIPALLTRGEFVINKRSAKKIGTSNLHGLNRLNAGGPIGFEHGGSTRRQWRPSSWRPSSWRPSSWRSSSKKLDENIIANLKKEKKKELPTLNLGMPSTYKTLKGASVSRKEKLARTAITRAPGFALPERTKELIKPTKVLSKNLNKISKGTIEFRGVVTTSGAELAKTLKTIENVSAKSQKREERRQRRIVGRQKEVNKQQKLYSGRLREASKQLHILDNRQPSAKQRAEADRRVRSRTKKLRKEGFFREQNRLLYPKGPESFGPLPSYRLGYLFQRPKEKVRIKQEQLPEWKSTYKNLKGDSVSTKIQRSLFDPPVRRRQSLFGFASFKRREELERLGKLRLQKLRLSEERGLLQRSIYPGGGVVDSGRGNRFRRKSIQLFGTGGGRAAGALSRVGKALTRRRTITGRGLFRGVKGVAGGALGGFGGILGGTALQQAYPTNQVAGGIGGAISGGALGGMLGGMMTGNPFAIPVGAVIGALVGLASGVKSASNAIVDEAERIKSLKFGLAFEAVQREGFKIRGAGVINRIQQTFKDIEKESPISEKFITRTKFGRHGQEIEVKEFLSQEQRLAQSEKRHAVTSEKLSSIPVKAILDEALKQGEGSKSRLEFIEKIGGQEAFDALNNMSTKANDAGVIIFDFIKSVNNEIKTSKLLADVKIRLANATDNLTINLESISSVSNQVEDAFASLSGRVNTISTYGSFASGGLGGAGGTSQFAGVFSRGLGQMDRGRFSAGARSVGSQFGFEGMANDLISADDAARKLSVAMQDYVDNLKAGIDSTDKFSDAIQPGAPGKFNDALNDLPSKFREALLLSTEGLDVGDLRKSIIASGGAAKFISEKLQQGGIGEELALFQSLLAKSTEALNSWIGTLTSATQAQSQATSAIFGAEARKLSARQQFAANTGGTFNLDSFTQLFEKQQAELTRGLGVGGGLDPKALGVKARELQKQIDASRNTLFGGFGPLGERVQTESVLSDQERKDERQALKNNVSQLASVNSALGRLANSATLLSAAQEKLVREQDVNQFKSTVADILTLGTPREKRDLYEGLITREAFFNAHAAGEGEEFFRTLSLQRKETLKGVIGQLPAKEQEEFRRKQLEAVGFTFETDAANEVKQLQTRAGNAQIEAAKIQREAANTQVKIATKTIETMELLIQSLNEGVKEKEERKARQEQNRGRAYWDSIRAEAKGRVSDTETSRRIPTHPFYIDKGKLGSAPSLTDLLQPLFPRGTFIPFDHGGKLSGFGSRDTVPAMLTPGEYVINAGATRNNLGLLEAINSGQRLRRGGRARGLSSDEREERRIARGERIRDRKERRRNKTLAEFDPYKRKPIRTRGKDEREERRIARGERIRDEKEKRKEKRKQRPFNVQPERKSSGRLIFSRILPKSQLEEMQRKTGGNAAVKKRLKELEAEKRERTIFGAASTTPSTPEKRSDSLKRAKDRIEKYKRKREEGRKDRSFASPTERSFQKPRRRNYFRPRGEALPPSRYIKARDAKISKGGRGVGGWARDELAEKLYKGRWAGHTRKVIPDAELTRHDPVTDKERDRLDKDYKEKGYMVKPGVRPSQRFRRGGRVRDRSERRDRRIARGERIRDEKEKRKEKRKELRKQRPFNVQPERKSSGKLIFSRILPKSQLEEMQRKTGGNVAVKKRLKELEAEKKERTIFGAAANIPFSIFQATEKRSNSLKRAKDRIEKYKRKREEGRKDRSFASPTERSFQKPRRRNYFRPRGEALPPSRYIRARDAKVSKIPGRGVAGQPRDELAERSYKGRWAGHTRKVIPDAQLTRHDPLTDKERDRLDKDYKEKGYMVKPSVRPRKRRISRGGGGIIPRRGFQTGGAVTGGGSGGPNFDSFSKSVERVGNSFSSFGQGVTELSSAVGDFSNAVNKFTEAVGGIPHELNITGEKTLNINLNGGALLREIMPEITSMIQSEIAEALRDSVDTSVRMRAQNKAAGMKRGDRR